MKNYLVETISSEGRVVLFMGLTLLKEAIRVQEYSLVFIVNITKLHHAG